jgi:hypothetical protein
MSKQAKWIIKFSHVNPVPDPKPEFYYSDTWMELWRGVHKVAKEMGLEVSMVEAGWDEVE